MQKKDLTGQKFGRLTVIKETPPHITSGGNRKVMWDCTCDCGTEHVIVPSGGLTQGQTKSCGCWNRDKASERMKQQKKYNRYDLESFEYGVGWTSNTNEEFYFDKEDFDKIKDICWYKHRQYIEGHVESLGKAVGLHKIIMDDIENLYDVDHINTLNHNDNRKCNLRKVSRTENNINHKPSETRGSGVNGVHYHKRKHRKDTWTACITVNGKYKAYDCNTFEEAVAKRKELEKEYYGEYSFDASQEIANKNKLEGDK